MFFFFFNYENDKGTLQNKISIPERMYMKGLEQSLVHIKPSVRVTYHYSKAKVMKTLIQVPERKPPNRPPYAR